ncbi:MAG: T9SS type A sorting domain-containing protein [Flavobacteriales bacterium]
MRLSLLTFIYCLACIQICANPGDTTVVQTFTHEAQNNPNTAYDSPGRRWFEFPAADNGVDYQKILLYYNLKCFEDGTAGNLGFPCGEWDYLTYTYIFQHTGLLDSNLVSHPTYLINNSDFDAASLTSQPTEVTHQYIQDYLVVDQTISETVVETSGTPILIAGPLTTNQRQRTQYLYRPDELLADGLITGTEIRKLAFNFSGVSADFQFMKIRLASSALTELNAITETAFTEVYSNDVSADGNGWQEFVLENTFIWDGTSSILLDISYTNSQENVNTPLCSSIEYTYPCMSAGIGGDKYLRMDWNDEVKVPAAAFQNINEEISIVMWNYGDPDFQPQDGTLFEGRGAQNQRVLNVHLPWSNGRIYWDAGSVGGYDRIDKAASVSEYEGKWNHWCFTKNTTTGSMKMYKNGVLWHSGANLDNIMEGIVEFSLGGATTWNNFYRGNVDEFAVFNIELDEATIAQWMNRDLDESHPNWSNLQVYYKFNEQDGEQVLDASGNGNNAWIHGNAARVEYTGDVLWRNTGGDFFKPQTRFISGEYVTTQAEMQHEWIEILPPVSIVQYSIDDYQPLPLSVDYDWYEGNSITITPEGDTINEIALPAEYTINNTDIEYYQAPFEIINRYELNRFITMYGIQLDLGDGGWTWVTDVTDWEPLLRDSVELESGNWQELLDMKFLFIEGPKAREVERVERVWDTNLGLNNFDAVVVDKTIDKLPGEEGWKLITTNTGHGFGNDNNNCGEFCNNIQSVDVNGQQQWQWEILQECADNPLYPQGGTWIYDRAGWCPGMNSAMKEFELTPHVQDGESFTVDYDITQDPYGNYVFFGTLIGYGPILHQHDPEIDMITAPSDWKIHSRWNPMCDNPRFILRNKGAQPLTDLNIYYGIEGGEMGTFHWTGNLGFMQSEEVELTYSDNSIWFGDDEAVLKFTLELGLSADGADENTSNNSASSFFTRPPQYQYADLDDNRLIIQLKTNDAYWHSAYTLYDINGNVVYARDDFAEANTTYRDTLQLNSGCYMFHVTDSEEDGLSFFANDDGNGNCKLDKVSGADFINFEADFGKEIKHYFQWNTNIVSVEESAYNIESSLRAVPNPADDHCAIQIRGFDRNVHIRMHNSAGKLVLDEMVMRKLTNDSFDLSTADLPAGLYTVSVTDGNAYSTVKVVVR